MGWLLEIGRSWPVAPRASRKIRRREASPWLNSVSGVALSTKMNPPRLRYSPRLLSSRSVSSKALRAVTYTKGVRKSSWESRKRWASTLAVIPVWALRASTRFGIARAALSKVGSRSLAQAVPR